METQIKYDGYIARQHDEVLRRAQYEANPLPADLDYRTVRGLSKEVQQILNQHKPETIGQASRISGVTPAAISLLLVHLKRGFGSRGQREQASAVVPARQDWSPNEEAGEVEARRTQRPAA